MIMRASSIQLPARSCNKGSRLKTPQDSDTGLRLRGGASRTKFFQILVTVLKDYDDVAFSTEQIDALCDLADNGLGQFSMRTLAMAKFPDLENALGYTTRAAEAMSSFLKLLVLPPSTATVEAAAGRAPPVSDLSGSLFWNLDPLSTVVHEEVARYVWRGSQLRERGGEFFEEVERLRKSRMPKQEKDFLIACASAGTGKTQAAFALKGPVLYLHLTEITQTSQLIYRVVSRTTSVFLACLERDVLTHGRSKTYIDTAYVNQLMLTNTPLYTTGFLSIILQNMPDSWDGIQGFIDVIDQLPSSLVQPLPFSSLGRIPAELVVVLDEVPPNSASSGRSSVPPKTSSVLPSLLVSFARSLFRVIGAATVMMGTDSAVANMLTNSSASTTLTSQPVLWATVITRFNNCVPDLLRHFEHFESIAKRAPCEPLFDFLRYQLIVCRPRICQMLLNCFAPPDEDHLQLRIPDSILETCDGITVLEEIVHKVSQQIFDGNGYRIGSSNGLLAQLCMLSTGALSAPSNLYAPSLAKLFEGTSPAPTVDQSGTGAAAAVMTSDTTSVKSPSALKSNSLMTAASFCVSSYFANLIVGHCGKKIYLHQPNPGLLVTADTKPWLPSFEFPYSETLLCMALTRRDSLACLTRVTYDDVNGQQLAHLTFRGALQNTPSSIRYAVGNPNAVTIIGELLEATSFAVAVLATHTSLQPLTVGEFVVNYCKEFDCIVALEDINRHLSAEIKSLCKIPYMFFKLSAPERDILLRMKWRAEVIERAKDADRVDVVSLSADSKRSRKTETFMAYGKLVIEDKERTRTISPDTLAGVLTRFVDYSDATLFIAVCSKFAPDQSGSWGTAVSKMDSSVRAWVAPTTFLHIYVGKEGKISRPTGIGSGVTRDRSALRVVVFLEVPCMED
eukprot:m.80720 g.80720  ORF g.80720 m.80720 type:complete len:903 (+) comp8053_c0_seq1:741-3449(+)